MNDKKRVLLDEKNSLINSKKQCMITVPLAGLLMLLNYIYNLNSRPVYVTGIFAIVSSLLAYMLFCSKLSVVVDRLHKTEAFKNLEEGELVNE